MKIVRYFGVADPPSGTVDHRHERRDFWSAYARDNDDGSVDVFYDRYICGKKQGRHLPVNDPRPGP